MSLLNFVYDMMYGFFLIKFKVSFKFLLHSKYMFIMEFPKFLHCETKEMLTMLVMLQERCGESTDVFYAAENIMSVWEGILDSNNLWNEIRKNEWEKNCSVMLFLYCQFLGQQQTFYQSRNWREVDIYLSNSMLFFSESSENYSK
jgi:hypothetical protein